MSMGVDLSSALTAEERAYLNERGRYAEVERADALHGVTDGAAPGSGDGTGPVVTPLGTAEQQAIEKERLLARLRDLGVNVAEVVDEPEGDTLPPYETWKSGELNAEIDRRNQDRADGDKISKAGSVTERADRLYMDDEKSA